MVLDANVLVSGIPAKSGTLASLIDLWRAKEFEVVISQHIIDEVRRAWTKPYWRTHLSHSQVERALRLIQRNAALPAITLHVRSVAEHDEDDLVLATAVSGNADYLVTENKGLLAVREYEGIVILTPREFLDRLS